METIRTDVVIVGASVAGTTAAALFARAGQKVLLIDRVRDAQAYKRQCTHFIQAAATPVLERLGVADELERVGAVKNGLQAWTASGGWVRLALDVERDQQGRRAHGYTLRRQKLDPILRENARRTEGVTLRLGFSVEALIVDDSGRVTGVELEGNGQRVRVEAKLVVGADGRHSKVAELAEMTAELSPHNRAGFFAYYRNVETKTGSDAQFWIRGEDVAYSFPSDDGLVCLTVVVNERKFDAFKADREGYLRAFFAGLPDAPDLSRAERASEFVGAANTPNTYRWPVRPGLALVGDAAMASDYIWGVGCGWALLSASYLVDLVAPALVAAEDLERALCRYAKRHKQELHTQHVQNNGFSASDRLPALIGAVLAAAPHDERLRELVALGAAGRISQRDVRIPLRLAFIKLCRLFQAPAPPARARFVQQAGARAGSSAG